MRNSGVFRPFFEPFFGPGGRGAPEPNRTLPIVYAAFSQHPAQTKRWQSATSSMLPMNTGVRW
jgi:hypothetical protein